MATLSELRKRRDHLIQAGDVRRALDIAFTVAERQPCMEAFFHLGCVQRDAGRYREAADSFRRALLYRRGPRVDRRRLHLHAAHVWYQLRRFGRMKESLRRASSCRFRGGMEFNVHISIGNYYTGQNDFPRALSEYEQALASSRNGTERGKALVNVGAILFRMVRLEEAGQVLDRAIRLMDNDRSRMDLALGRLARAAVHFDQGHAQQAFGMLDRCANAFRNLGNRNLQALALMNAGYVSVEMGRWRRAMPLLNSAVRLARAVGNEHILTSALAARAIATARLGNPVRARADLREAVRVLPRQRFSIPRMAVLRAEARIAELEEAWELMRSASVRAQHVARCLQDPIRVAEFRRLQSVAEENLGRPRAAENARRIAEDLDSAHRVRGSGVLRLVRKAVRLAPSAVPVLIVGEPGTGKTDLARLIHRLGPRRRCILVPCEQLVSVSRDLCGHVAGAWSGAGTGSRGLIGRAACGTVVLDRLDELSPDSQRELIPILEGRVRPVGSASERRVQVRFIATCLDERRLIPGVRARVAGAVLQTLPLRDRRDQFDEIVRRILRNRRRITCEAMAELAQRPWDGNFTELRAAMDRLVAFTSRSIGRKEVARFVPRSDTIPK